MRDKIVLISYTGYKPKKILLTNLKEERTKILLEVVSVSLAEVSVFPQDPLVLIKAVLANQKTNFVQDERLMTAFYRESILKRKSYASLSEAVVEVYKQSYGSHRSDAIRLLKSRKSADYDKLDTVLFKLQGGPYNALMLDVMKDPNMIISYETMDMYDFKFVGTTRLNERLVYVLSFAQKTAEKDPLFYGKLFVDAESLALSSAAYSINLTNKDEASTLFIKKKPMGAKVYPTEANFMVNYRMQNGKWMYAYSRGDLAFKFNWDKKLFNTIYNVTYEMVVTNWVAAETKPFAVDNRLKMNVVMRDEAKGFGDDDFWGAYNVIEPEKTIEVAIKKIQKSIKELEK